MPVSKPDTDKDKGDAKLQAEQTSALGHILHEVAVQADGTEDPGAGIEQMVESQADSGSSLLTSNPVNNASDRAAPQVPAILKPPLPKKPV
ncbi:hypothetical protein ACVBEF_13590 [Glaciimonas sp. GG7]